MSSAERKQHRPASAADRRRLVILVVVVAAIGGCTASPKRVPSGVAVHRSSVEASRANSEEQQPAPNEPDLSQNVVRVSYQGVSLGELLALDPQAPSESGVVADPVVPTTDTGLRLETVEQLALESSPAIRQALQAAAKAGALRYQVGRKPNPTVGYFGEEIGNGGAGGLHGGFVSQTFVRGEKLQWNRQVFNQAVNESNWHVQVQRQRILTDVRVAFYQALSAQQRIRLAQDFRGIAEQAVRFAAEQLDAKIGTLPDVLQSEIQLNEIELSIRQAEVESAAAMTELAALAGVAGFEEQTVSGSFGQVPDRADEESVFAQIAAMSPELAAAKARIERARAHWQRQQVQSIPNLTAQLGAGGDDATGDAFANLQLSVPLPVHNKNLGNVHAAHADYCAAVQNVQRLQSRIRRDLARVMREYRLAKATVERFESAILPNASRTVELMQEAREAGEFDFLRVLTARRSYFDANLKYVDAQSRLAQANARIEGLLLFDGLSNTISIDVDDGVRSQALTGQ